MAVTGPFFRRSFHNLSFSVA